MHHANTRGIGSRPHGLFLLFVGVGAAVSGTAAMAQLTDEALEALRRRGEAEGWTFTVDHNSATRYPLQQLCGLVIPPDWERMARWDPCEPTRDLPVAFDWRDYDGVTPVRSQGSCGSCWAFGAIGTVESVIKIEHGSNVNLSEQWLVSCTDAGSCDGGWHGNAYEYLLCIGDVDPCGDGGAVLESDFPYEAADVPCGCPYPHPYCLFSWAYIGGSGSVPNTAKIKQAIYDHGPVAAGVYVNDAFWAYSGGVFNGCESETINHVIVLVGWDDNQGPEGVWIGKNSWGTGWGESGFIRIPYGCSKIGFGSAYSDYLPVSGLWVSPQGFVYAEGPVGGPFTPDSFIYTLQNRGEEPMDFTVTKNKPWIDLSQGSGSIAGESSVDIAVSFNSITEALGAGHHDATLEFVNKTGHEGDTKRMVHLMIGDPAPVYQFPMDTDPGWSTQDDWAWGKPKGQGGEHGYADPTGGHTGSAVYGYNLYGDYPNDLPPRHLTTSLISCEGVFDVHLKFWRWLGVEQPLYDHASVSVSTNSSEFKTIWANTEEITDSSWTFMDLDISGIVDNKPTVWIRWTMGETDGGWRYCGWNIDDVELWGVLQAAECYQDITGDGVVDVLDLLAVLAAWGMADVPADVNFDGIVDVLDLLEILGAWGPCS